jgi:hypothetical protein
VLRALSFFSAPPAILLPLVPSFLFSSLVVTVESPLDDHCKTMAGLQRVLEEALQPHAAAAVLVRRKDGAVRASFPGPEVLSRDDLQRVSRAFKDGVAARSQPLVLRGQEYDCVRADDRSVYARQRAPTALASPPPEVVVFFL